MSCDLLGRLVLVMAVLHSAVGLPKAEVCLLQVEEGTCNEDVTRYFYNTITQKCEEFIYSGCGGNQNNFRSFLECQKTCFKIPKIPRVCRFERDEGPCRGLFKRFFYNMTSMQCESFDYGGCRGNENNFENLQSCIEFCRPSKTTPVICHDVLDKGSCSASMTRFYYDSVAKTCREFIYTGCGRSSNNFTSRKSCMDVCSTAGIKPLKKPVLRVRQQFLKRMMMGQPQRAQ